MKKVIIDLNVIMDYLGQRPGHERAAAIIDLCVNEKLQAYICAQELTTLIYFLSKYSLSRHKTKILIHELLGIFEVLPLTEPVLREALSSPISDLEDAVVEISALRNDVDYIITRNLKDFKNSRITVCTPIEAVSL